jgi:hypothetical protein
MMDGNQPVIIYISAASDLMAEREALARMIAELPVSLPWRIMQTPVEAEPLDTGALLAADFYFLIMGADIRAPVGSELHLARQAQRSIVGFAKRGVTYTPAGQIFSRQAQIDWRSFKDAADLSQQVQRLIVEQLLAQAIAYRLMPEEVIQLEQLLKTTPVAGQEVRAGGAGHSAVLLSRERYMPGEGVIIDEP